MKKLILTLLLTSLASYSQTVNVDLVVRNIIPINWTLYDSEAKALTVPAGRIWMVNTYQLNVKPIGFSSYVPNSTSQLITAGTKVYSYTTSNTGFVNIIEFNAPSTQTGTLALNEIKEINNKIELFPNPTNSKIALNSEKNYTIEIYDMQGQIVMKDKGNTVDLSNLSNAVYILKAYDNYEKTTTSYKVVKK
jgi:hypothetical protein